jgi:5-methylthioadenosine/S-adenosylhomocysteine deaminase
MSLLIRNARILQTLSDHEVTVLEHCDVRVEGARIAAVRPSSSQPEAADETIEANGQLLMPGLINCHSHVPMVIFRGLAEDVSLEKWFNDYMWPLESNLREEDVYWGMLLGWPK